MINNSSLVTIAIPAYKRHWLSESIESALNQDYQNIELLIVDDHSPQGLKEIVDPYLNDPRVRFYCNAKNLGKESIVLNWNRCLELAKGEFFILLCDDDILMPHFVSTLMSYANIYPQCNVFHGRRVILDMKNGVEKRDPVWPEYETCEQYMKNGGFFRMHSITEFMYRTDHIRKILFTIYPMGWGSDDISILRFIEKGGIVSSRDCIAVFRRSSEHISKPFYAAYEKAKARLLEFRFFKNYSFPPCKEEKMNEIMGGEVFKYLPYMTKFERLKILYQTPFCAFPWKTWVWILLFGWNRPSTKIN